MKKEFNRVISVLIFIAVSFAMLPSKGFSNQESTKSPETIYEEDYYFHIPSRMDLSKKHPLIISLSHKADADINLGLWINAAERYKWFVYADKRHRSDDNMRLDSMKIIAHVKKLMKKYPIDRSKIIAAGFSEGGTVAHALAFESKLVSGVISSCGIISDHYKFQVKKYPKGKKAVFLTGDADYNYDKIKRDFKYLEGLQWDTYWINSDVGHRFPKQTKSMEAATWFDNHWK